MHDEARRPCDLDREVLSIDEWAGGCAHLESTDAARDGPCAQSCAVEPRRHVQARAEVAAAAGIALASVDGEPLAALRGLACAAEHTLRPSERYAAIWAGFDAVYGWRVAERVVQASMCFPNDRCVDLESALRGLAGSDGLDRAIVGGDLGLLERLGVTVADIGERLGCTAAAFECASFCCDGALTAKPADWRHAASFAVAFGLAVRGVYE